MIKSLLFIAVTASLISGVTWPQNTANCERWREEGVLNPPACPDNEVVRVSHDGGNGTISFKALLAIAGFNNNRTPITVHGLYLGRIKPAQRYIYY